MWVKKSIGSKPSRFNEKEEVQSSVKSRQRWKRSRPCCMTVCHQEIVCQLFSQVLERELIPNSYSWKATTGSASTVANSTFSYNQLKICKKRKVQDRIQGQCSRNNKNPASATHLNFFKTSSPTTVIHLSKTVKVIQSCIPWTILVRDQTINGLGPTTTSAPKQDSCASAKISLAKRSKNISNLVVVLSGHLKAPMLGNLVLASFRSHIASLWAADIASDTRREQNLERI